MKKYLRIYGMFLKLSWASMLAYRANTINGIISSIVWGCLNFLVMILLTSRTSNVFGWKREDLLLLSGTSTMFFGIYHFLFSRNFRQFSNIVSLGQLDSYLLKPIDSQFLLSVRESNYANLARVILGIGFISYIIVLYHIPVSIVSIIAYVFLLIFSLLMLYNIWFLFITLLVWFPDLSNILDFLYELNNISRFPPEMYKGGKELLFLFVFPLTFTLVVPVKTLIQKFTFIDVLSLVLLCLTAIFLSRKFWHFALKHYTSANG